MSFKFRGLAAQRATGVTTTLRIDPTAFIQRHYSTRHRLSMQGALKMMCAGLEVPPMQLCGCQHLELTTGLRATFVQRYNCRTHAHLPLRIYLVKSAR